MDDQEPRELESTELERIMLPIIVESYQSIENAFIDFLKRQVGYNPEHFRYMNTLLKRHFNSMNFTSFQINEYLRHELAQEGDSDSYERKKQLVKGTSKILKEDSRRIIFPLDGEQSGTWNVCNLYAIASRDGAGRYTFERHGDKKRRGSYKSIEEVMPLQVIEFPPRDFNDY